MKNRKARLLLLFIFGFGILSLNGCSSDTFPNNSIGSASDKNEDVVTLDSYSENIDTIYDTEYQTKIYNEIESLKTEEYTLDTPLVIANPYGTNTTGLYVYFQTDTPTKISYTVSVDGYNDFSETLYGDYTTEHEHQLIGMLPGKENKITLTASDESGQNSEKTLTYFAPDLMGDNSNVQLTVKEGSSTQELSNGLYTMLGNRSEENNEEVDFILLYDNDGVLRSEIPIKSYRSCNLLFDNQTMYYSTSANEIAALSNTGRITRIYDTGDYKLHHDYIFGENNDILVLATKKDSPTVEDRIVSIDRETGAITEIIDLTELFSQYYGTLKEQDGLDWMHINSIDLLPDNSIVISSRETSSIIKIDNIYTSPSVDYLISSEKFWSDSGYEDLLLKQKGDFTLNAGQHCVTYEASDNLEEGQYYLYMFNNNNATIASRDYDYSKDDQYDGTYTDTNGEKSYYYKYLVDENKRTFELVERIPVTYSGYVSSVQHLGDNILTDSGEAFSATEFDKNRKPIRTVTGSGETWWYRVFKYDYKNYWFE